MISLAGLISLINADQFFSPMIAYLVLLGDSQNPSRLTYHLLIPNGQNESKCVTAVSCVGGRGVFGQFHIFREVIF
jgi:hypothetical protein